MRFQPVLSVARADEQFKPQGAPPTPDVTPAGLSAASRGRPPPPRPAGINPRPVVPASIAMMRGNQQNSIQPPRGMPARFRPTSMSTSMSSRSSRPMPSATLSRRDLPPPPTPTAAGLVRPSLSQETSLILATAAPMNAVAPPPNVAPPPGRSSRPSGGRARATGDYLPRRLFGFSSTSGAQMTVPSQFERRQMLVRPLGSSSYGYSRSQPRLQPMP
jgi:hypothetical protein